MAFTEILNNHDRLMQESANRQAAEDAKAAQESRKVPNKEMLTKQLKDAVSEITGGDVFEAIKPELTSMASALHQKLVAAKYDLPAKPIPVAEPAIAAWRDTALADQIAAQQLLKDILASECQKSRGGNCVVLAPEFVEKIAPKFLLKDTDSAGQGTCSAVVKILMAYAGTDIVPDLTNDEHGVYFELNNPIDIDLLGKDLSGPSRSPGQPA